jgi:asparagine synthase (glutamine-hydrolysing)
MVDLAPAGALEEAVAAMTATLHHRGPDGSGMFASPGVGLGHTRLAIVDLTDSGRQPMQSGRFTVVYNGELYNHLDLRRQLEAEGVRFRGRSDTETVLEALVHWGTGALARFNGMFALALWDEGKRRLVLARDRFGIKPLYWTRLPDGAVVFGSEIKALLASGRLHRRVDAAGLHEYLWFGNALGDRTLFSGIHKLLAGHFMVVEAGAVHAPQPFWHPAGVPRPSDDFEGAAMETRDRLEAAVRRHLQSDVPVGVALSGGIDSSAIAALATRHYPGRLATYSVGFDFDATGGELPKARRVAETFGTEHHELRLAGGDLAGVIETLVRSHDQPFGDAAHIALYLLARELSGKVKVVLQGDGGDEMFAGYRRYAALAHTRLWEAAARALPVLDAAAALHPMAARLGRFVRAAGEEDGALRMGLLLTQESARLPPTRLLSAAWRQAVESHDPFARYREVGAHLEELEPVQRMLHTDALILLPDIFLEKVDRPTMAHGIEVRVPFLDAELAAYAMALPAPLKVQGRSKKRLLRRALRGVVPDEVLDAPKTGFGVPYGAWLRGPLLPWMRAVLREEQGSLLDAAAVDRALGEHAAGVRDHGFVLYKVLSLALWRRHYGVDLP